MYKEYKIAFHTTMTEQPTPWTHLSGSLAWAPIPDRHPLSNTKSNTTSSTLLFWPVILYPSWSTAARSPLFDCDGEILLMGCQKPVSKENLCSNRVPSRVALGKGVNGSKYRLKVVAHFLGLSSRKGEQTQISSESWGSVRVDSLQQYTLEICETNIQLWERNGKDVHWNLLLNAMKEAATLMEQNAFDPMKLCQNIGIDPNYKNFSDSAIMEESLEKDADLKEQNNATKKTRKVNLSSTPENFHDWNQQSESQTQTKFSQAITS